VSTPRTLERTLADAAAGPAASEVIWVDDAFGRGEPQVTVAIATGRRLQQAGGDARVVCCADVFGQDDATVASLRIAVGAAKKVSLGVRGRYALETSAAGGWLLVPERFGAPLLWFPAAPMLRAVDSLGRILAERTAPVAAIRSGSDSVQMAFDALEAESLDVVVWQLPRGSDWSPAGELSELSAAEVQRWFLWGTHDAYASPADLYAHLIHGRVYERRFAWPFRRKICSENDAHALYVVLAGLERAAPKRLYSLLRAQTLLSLLARQSPDGGFRHGEWTDGMESHYRLQASAMHLMMDALVERDDPAVRAALERAACFLSAAHDRLDSGTWFLHDELERSVESLARGPFKWVRSRAFGKSESNMLVLNTHLDSMIALDRYREITGDTRYAALVESGRQAAAAVLTARPAEGLYRLLSLLTGLTLLPTAEAKVLPLWKRALKRLTTQYVIPALHRVKARYPRLVMPGGYIERELCLHTFAHDYQSVNVTDLARYVRRFPDAPAIEALAAGLKFCRRSGILRRWKEMRYQRYALGFWAEALYHVCLQRPDPEYRAWLAEAILDLEELSLGLPPSLLGANSEAVPPDRQMPCPVPGDDRLRVANLGTNDRPELLVVNAAAEAVPLQWFHAPAARLEWIDAAGRACGTMPPAIPARGWLRAVGERARTA
jgi:hypothetical protein